MAEMGLSAGVMRRYRIFETRGYYICIIYTPNLGLGISFFDQEREQSRFKGSTEGVIGEQRGAAREHR